MRRALIAGNWKMNKTASQTRELVEAILPLVKDSEAEVVVCPPFVNLETASKAVSGSEIKLGAQNMHHEPNGAFTGEISSDMLTELGVQYVIIGHSERRQYFGETDESVNLKVKAALKSGLVPIVCVGEGLDEREANITSEIVRRQAKLALLNISSEEAEHIVIAYEPIWAIGTGKTATSREANETIGQIRNAIKESYSEEVSEKVRILYGGSMKPSNAAELMAEKEIDGGLIGGASLVAEDFAAIVNYKR